MIEDPDPESTQLCLLSFEQLALDCAFLDHTQSSPRCAPDGGQKAACAHLLNACNRFITRVRFIAQITIELD